MALRRGLSFVGVAQERLEVGEPVLAADMATIADDQAFNFEKMTGTSAADGTSASTVTIHKHSEEGNLIFRTLAAQVFEVNASSLASAAGAWRIVTSTASTPGTYRALPILVFVPRGFENRPIALMFDCQGDPRFKFTVYDDTMAAVTDMENIPLMSAYGSEAVGLMAADANLDLAQTYGATFEVTAAGLYVLDVMTDIQAVGEERVIKSMLVVGAYDPLHRNDATDADAASTGTNVTVGDPDNSNAWHPVDDKLVTANEALHAATLTILTHNNNRNYEQMTGQPAPGNAAITMDPHKHDGDGQDGEEIECTVWQATLGGDGHTNAYGTRSAGPTADTVTGGIVAYAYAYLHDSANAAAANSKVKFAALVWCESGKGSTMQVLATLGSTTKTFQTTGAAAGIHVLKTPTAGTNQFGFTTNANNIVGLTIKQTVVGTSICRLYSGVFYVDV